MSAAVQAASRPRVKAAPRIDTLALLVLPAALFLVALFVYPFLYGLWLSFRPADGSLLGNYAKFFADPLLLRVAYAYQNTRAFGHGPKTFFTFCNMCQSLH